MAEPIQFMFDHQEVVELLIKQQGIREGLWMASVEFGLVAATVPAADGKILPAAISLVQRIGIKKHDGPPTNLTVDARALNRPPQKKMNRAKKKKARK